MTVGTQPPRVEYTEDGSTTVFSVPYAFFDDTDLVVTRFTGTGTHDSDAHLLVLGSNYSVSGGYTPEGGPAVGSITMLTAAVVGAKLRIDRFTKRSQELHYVPGDDFPARSHENGLDREEMQIQELDRDALTIDNLAEALAHIIIAGPGIRVDYDDDANTITITNTQVEGVLADLPDCLMLSGDQQTWTGDLGEGNTGGLTAEDVRDIIVAMLTAGTNITLTENDLANTLTIASAGGGGGGGDLAAILAEIVAEDIGDNQIWVGNGATSLEKATLTDYMKSLFGSADLAALRTSLAFLGVTASSLGSPGYVKLTNGVKLSWGTSSCAGDTTTTITYPSAYTTFSVPVGSGGSSSTSESDNVRVQSAGTASFVVVNNKESAVTFFWFAIGV